MAVLKGKTLSLKQEAFCKLYSTSEEFFCNGVQSYIASYKPDQTKKGWYNVARNAVSRLLTNPNILKRIDELVELEALNDPYVDKQLGKLVQQDADMKTKLGAIKEYNVLKERIRKKLELTGKDGERLEGIGGIVYIMPDGTKATDNKADIQAAPSVRGSKK